MTRPPNTLDIVVAVVNLDGRTNAGPDDRLNVVTDDSLDRRAITIALEDELGMVITDALEAELAPLTLQQVADRLDAERAASVPGYQ